ncbi:MAG: hypothetical protein ABDH29_07900 [Aquificaceae bacterium]
MLLLILELLKKRMKRSLHTTMLSPLFWLISRLKPSRKPREEENPLLKLAIRTFLKLLSHSKVYIHLLIPTALAKTLSFFLAFARAKIKRA